MTRRDKAGIAVGILVFTVMVMTMMVVLLIILDAAIR